MTTYASAWEQSISDPKEFWGQAAQAINWYREPSVVLDNLMGPLYQWFPDGQLNTCYNALDRHVENGRGDQLALIYDSPVTDTKTTYTYQQLLDEVSLFAGVLRELGVAEGDRVVIYLPMIPQAVIAMLACARIGAVALGGLRRLRRHELAMRIDDAQPKVVVSASCGIEVNA